MANERMAGSKLESDEVYDGECHLNGRHA